MTVMRVIYVGKDQALDGKEGDAWLARGHYDPKSAEFKAILFTPDDGPEAGYYCEFSDLEPVPGTPGSPD